MKTISFIRHAQSQANAGQATIDDATIKLTDLGRQQAIALAETIIQKPDLIICSKYLRIQLTSIPLISKFPHVRVNILPLHEFTYLSSAKCASTTTHQRENWVVDYWEYNDADYIHDTGAESFTQFIKRIQLCLDILTTIEYHNIIVFTHGHVLRAIWQILAGHQFLSADEQMHHFYHNMGLLPVPNTCIFKANFSNNEWQIIEPQLPDFLFL
jgi:probable phosphoglycerate mutase